MIHIDIVSDTVCPWCYIGKRRLEKAIAERPLYRYQTSWRPFQLNPDLPVGGMTRDDYLHAKFGGTDRASRVYSAVLQAGREEALNFNFAAIRRQPNTFDTHRLVRWAASIGVQDKVVERLFHRYFIDGVDISAQDELLRVAGDCGMDADLVADLFGADADVELVREEETVARKMGINGVPCFIINGKYAVSGAQDPTVLVHVFDLTSGADAAQAADGAAAD